MAQRPCVSADARHGYREERIGSGNRGLGLSWSHTWVGLHRGTEGRSEEQDRGAGRTVRDHVGRARSGAGHATGGMVAFPELRGSKRDKQGTVGFVSTRPTQPQQKQNKLTNLVN